MSSNQILSGTGRNGDHRVFSTYYDDAHVIQQVCIVHPKNLIIDTLRRYFSRDEVYTYRQDEYGFPLVVNREGLAIDSEESTDILITDVYALDASFYPVITIQHSGGSSKPISFNQNGTVKYRKTRTENENGLFSDINIPTHRVYTGAWDLNFQIGVYSKTQSELEEIMDVVAMILQYSAWQELRENGLFIKSLSIGGESTEPYSNAYIYSQTISISVYSEWRAEIPLYDTVEKLLFFFETAKTPILGASQIIEPLDLKYSDITDYALFD